MYHRFEENKYPSTNIRIKDFKIHLNLIKEAGLKFVYPNKFDEYINKRNTWKWEGLFNRSL